LSEASLRYTAAAVFRSKKQNRDNNGRIGGIRQYLTDPLQSASLTAHPEHSTSDHNFERSSLCTLLRIVLLVTHPSRCHFSSNDAHSTGSIAKHCEKHALATTYPAATVV
jgi:hypothetical protein